MWRIYLLLFHCLHGENVLSYNKCKDPWRQQLFWMEQEKCLCDGVLHIKMQHGRMTLFSFFSLCILVFSCHLLNQNGWIRLNQLLSGIICDIKCHSALKKKEKNMKQTTWQNCFYKAVCSFLKELFLSSLT